MAGEARNGRTIRRLVPVPLATIALAHSGIAKPLSESAPFTGRRAVRPGICRAVTEGRRPDPGKRVPSSSRGGETVAFADVGTLAGGSPGKSDATKQGEAG